MLDLQGSDVSIYNRSLVFFANESSGFIDNYACKFSLWQFRISGADIALDNPNLSSSATKDSKLVTFRNTTTPTDNSTAYTESVTYHYTSDNYTLGGHSFSPRLEFISSSHSKRVGRENFPKSDFDTSFDIYPRLGLGLPETSLMSADLLSRNETNIPQGVIADLKHGASFIRSKSYSIWVDPGQNRTAHLLFGGVDKHAFVAPLITLNTTLFHPADEFGRAGPLFTVNTSIVSTTVAGQNSSRLDLQIGRASLTMSPDTGMPFATVRRIWDAIGADYISGLPIFGNESLLADPNFQAGTRGLVPCSYLTNTTTIDFQFAGLNTTIAVPMSDLTISQTENEGRDRRCSLLLRPIVDEEDFAFLGTPFLKKVYHVHDLDNKVVSVALVNTNASTTRDIVPIPENGGVASMNLSATNSSGTPSAASGLRGSLQGVSTLGVMAILVAGTGLL